MGYVSQGNQPLGPGVINKLLRVIKEEIEEQNAWIAREYVKVGDAAALAVCASLQGSDIFLLDLDCGGTTILGRIEYYRRTISRQGWIYPRHPTSS